ncbi:hypothetical protein RchiOBHm_Chr4g0415101 [Rosa chinensis]|uniref:Uncharacterized protein n=1 Tax=Rosa chinensis TaxID=74649 RepID=A0A2P6QWK5_ROSCH|nr:hypothetical protein RchiOBHm_Chr4g0415101 [Rosa chinensis]
MTVGIFIGLLSQFSVGRWLLLKFLSFFSVGWFRNQGPSDEEVRSASFKKWFVGHGFSDRSLASQENKNPDMEIVTRVMGPEIGYYNSTSVCTYCSEPTRQSSKGRSLYLAQLISKKGYKKMELLLMLFRRMLFLINRYILSEKINLWLNYL